MLSDESDENDLSDESFIEILTQKFKSSKHPNITLDGHENFKINSKINDILSNIDYCYPCYDLTVNHECNLETESIGEEEVNIKVINGNHDEKYKINLKTLFNRK